MVTQMKLSASWSPTTILLCTFIAWKALVLTIALLAPGIGYDTSTSLILHDEQESAQYQDTPASIKYSVLKLVRWDAIYFTAIAQHGHVFEQEWAFGKGFPAVLKYASQVFRSQYQSDLVSHTHAGMLISHLSHGASVVLLFWVTKLITNPSSSGAPTTALTAAVLHIVSPACIFLSAPYTESLFSFLNMLGYYLYTRGARNSDTSPKALDLMCKLAAGVVFGLATAIRSNGILSGIPFFIDAVQTTLQLLHPGVDMSAKPSLLLQLQFTVLAGCSVGVGFIYPQFLAYRDYCILGSGDRPWCRTHPPSIFSFVQSHYWNVGFLRYWTLSNVPLFLLAMPCLCILISSGVHAVKPGLSQQRNSLKSVSMRIALPQLILALLALTSYHVQIINRLSSGYPTWYIWLAAQVKSEAHFNSLLRGLIIYGLIQAVLFASFLPPA